MSTGVSSIILNVDDNEDVRSFRTFLLTQAGYRVIEAATGNEALRLAKKENPELILLDVNLPDISGLEVCRRIKFDKLTASIPVLQISAAYVTNHDRVRGLENGADNYLSTPVDPDVLTATIKSMLRLRQTQAALQREMMERERSEQALRAADKLITAIVQASPLAVFALEPSGIITSWNPAAERIFGWSEDEVINNELPIVPPAKKETWQKLFSTTLWGDSLTGVSMTMQRKDGTMIDTSVSIASFDSEGAGNGVIVIVEDVTHRKQLEAQLRQAQKMESIGTLAGGVAHDFNNVLTGVIGFTDLMMSRLSPSDPFYNPLQQVRKLGDRAATLTRQLLAFARRQVLDFKNVSLNAAITDSLKFLGRVIGEHIELKLDLNADVYTIHADVAQIEQVLTNLCINARDAMPRGGRLVIETKNITLDETYVDNHPDAKTGNYVMLAVTDNGEGMDQATRERIFEPFFTTKEFGKGTGLGLAMVYGIIKQHGGLIYVYSEPGLGTSFKIYLPAVEHPAEPISVTRQEIPVGGTETILLAEDETAVRELVVAVLASLGYRVITANDGEEALRLFDKYEKEIDLVLSDTIMPRLGGKELYEAVHQRKPEVRFVFMSGYNLDTVGEGGLPVNDVDFLQKPFSPVVLGRKIREVLDHQRTGGT
jgi:PAS domain S-box-containing protein